MGAGTGGAGALNVGLSGLLGHADGYRFLRHVSHRPPRLWFTCTGLNQTRRVRSLYWQWRWRCGVYAAAHSSTSALTRAWLTVCRVEVRAYCGTRLRR